MMNTFEEMELKLKLSCPWTAEHTVVELTQCLLIPQHLKRKEKSFPKNGITIFRALAES